MAKAIFTLPDGSRQEVDVPVGESLMKAAVAADIVGISGECGGAASCATCKVQVAGSWWDRVPAATELEESLIEDCEPNTRLSCQVCMTAELDGVEVTVPFSQYG